MLIKESVILHLCILAQLECPGSGQTQGPASSLFLSSPSPRDPLFPRQTHRRGLLAAAKQLCRALVLRQMPLNKGLALLHIPGIAT